MKRPVTTALVGTMAMKRKKKSLKMKEDSSPKDATPYKGNLSRNIGIPFNDWHAYQSV